MQTTTVGSSVKCTPTYTPQHEIILIYTEEYLRYSEKAYILWFICSYLAETEAPYATSRRAQSRRWLTTASCSGVSLSMPGMLTMAPCWSNNSATAVWPWFTASCWNTNTVTHTHTNTGQFCIVYAFQCQVQSLKPNYNNLQDGYKKGHICKTLPVSCLLNTASHLKGLPGEWRRRSWRCYTQM